MNHSTPHKHVGPPDAAPDEEFIAKTMRTFFEGERLARIPGKQKAQLVVLAHMFTRFDPAQRYTEKQVNEILAPIHEDVAFWRRALVDYGYLERQDGVYWVRLGSH